MNKIDSQQQRPRVETRVETKVEQLHQSDNQPHTVEERAWQQALSKSPMSANNPQFIKQIENGSLQLFIQGYVNKNPPKIKNDLNGEE